MRFRFIAMLLLAGCDDGGSAQGDASPDGTTQDAATPGDGGDAGKTGDSSSSLAFDIPFASLMAHNTSANAAYDQAHFPANFGTQAWVSQSGTKISVDPTKSDESFNPVTPAHVSNVDVHTLIPSRHELRWFAHITPWFKLGGGNHIDIGLQMSTAAYVKSMLADMKQRGFDGIVVDWYGQGSYEDSVTLLLQQALDADPNEKLTFIIMLDAGINNLSESVLEQQLAYAQKQYFGDAHYELENKQPIVMFFGVNGALGDAAMAMAKTNVTPNAVWVTQDSSTLSLTYVDESYDWAHVFLNGDSTTDPYNLAAVKSYYAGVASSSKKAFGSMISGFNGTLTAKLKWSLGKYVPRGDGACEVQWAKTINQVIPKNVTRMQWVTWSDWEEGSEIEAAVENGIAVTASRAGDTLSWSVSGGTGDESTLDHYEVYATPDGVNAADLGSVAIGQPHTLALGGVAFTAGTYQLYVKAIGKPNMRDHMSAAVAYTK